MHMPVRGIPQRPGPALRRAIAEGTVCGGERVRRLAGMAADRWLKCDGRLAKCCALVSTPNPCSWPAHSSHPTSAGEVSGFLLWVSGTSYGGDCTVHPFRAGGTNCDRVVHSTRRLSHCLARPSEDGSSFCAKEGNAGTVIAALGCTHSRGAFASVRGAPLFEAHCCGRGRAQRRSDPGFLRSAES